MGEEKAHIIRLKADLSFEPRPRCVLTSSGYRVEVLTLGCSSTCASVAVVSSLPTLPPEVGLNICGRGIPIRLSGTPLPRSDPLLLVHGRCDLELGGRTLGLPCGGETLPAYLEVGSVEEDVQEMGLNVRGKVLYKGDLSIYLLLLPGGGELVGEGVRFRPGSYLLIIGGKESARLNVDGEELVLP